MMDVESVQDRRVERVENRRPSEVFLALWRERTIRAEIGVDEFAALADVWQQIRQLEEIAARERRREDFAQKMAEAWFPPRGDMLRPFDGETAQEPREGQAPPLQTPTEREADEPREGQAPPLQTPPEPVSDEPIPERVQDPGDPSAAGTRNDPAADPAIDAGPPVCAPVRDDNEAVSESDHPMTEGDGEWEPFPAKKPVKARAKAGQRSMATRKRNILAALRHARADGVNLQTVADQVQGLTINSVMDVLDAKNLPLPVWTAIEKAMKKLGYPPAAEAGEKEADA